MNEKPDLARLRREFEEFDRSMMWTLSRASREGVDLDPKFLQGLMETRQSYLKRIKKMENSL